MSVENRTELDWTGLGKKKIGKEGCRIANEALEMQDCLHTLHTADTHRRLYVLPSPIQSNPIQRLRRRQLTALLPNRLPRQLPLLDVLHSALRATAGVQRTEIAVPPQAHHIDDEHAHVGRNVLEVGKLHPRPDHEVLGQAGHVRLLEARLHRGPLEIRHRRQEETHVYGREEELVAGDAREDRAVYRRRVDVLCEDAVPGGCGGAEDDWAGV
jgi:hypothetical protein